LIRVGLNACIAPVGSLPAWAAPALAIGTGAILYFFVDSQRYPAGLLAVMAGLAAGILVFGLPRSPWARCCLILLFPPWTISQGGGPAGPSADPAHAGQFGHGDP